MPLRPPDDTGQAAVELVALLPIVAALLALAWQAVLAGEAAWEAASAARAAARAAAIGEDAERVARGRLPERLERGLRVREPHAGSVEVSVRIPQVVTGIALGRVRATGHFQPQEAR
jgi:hypothetical protein